MRIEDGIGTGKEAKVNSDNRLVTFSTVEAEVATISKDKGLSFVFSHDDFINVTTTNTETGILHVKNTSTSRKLYIESIRTCGAVINKWKLYKNSNAGTLITDQTAGNSQNLNVTSSNVAAVTVYKGAEGKTVSGGTMLGHLINDVGHSDERFEGAIILGTNDSIELSVEVPSAGDVCCRVIGYYI